MSYRASLSSPSKPGVAGYAVRQPSLSASHQMPRSRAAASSGGKLARSTGGAAGMGRSSHRPSRGKSGALPPSPSARRAGTNRAAEAPGGPAARKNAGGGKSVAVRVELGGSRVYKKKKNK